MPQTTYRLLMNEFTPASVMRSLQAYTGAYLNYGLDHTINIVDILDNCGMEAMLYCLQYCTADTTALQLALGLEMTAAWSQLWTNYNPGDDRLSRVLYFSNLLLQSSGEAGTPPRLNYCGDILPGASGIPLDSILESVTEVQGLLDGLSLSKANMGSVVVTQLTATDTGKFGYYNASEFGYNYQPIPTPSGQPIQTFQDVYWNSIKTNLRGYIEERISLAVVNGDMALQSVAFNTTTGPTFGILAIGAGGTVNDYGAYTQYYIGQSVICAANAVIVGVPDNSAIYQSVVQAVNSYALDQRLDLVDSLYQLGQMATGSSPPEPGAYFVDPGLINEVISAGEAYRSATLVDASFWSAFDADFSLGLNMTERYKGELALRAGILAARQAKSKELYANATAEMNGWLTFSDNLAIVVRPYLI